jgi:hypothetical protein
MIESLKINANLKRDEGWCSMWHQAKEAAHKQNAPDQRNDLKQPIAAV